MWQAQPDPSFCLACQNLSDGERRGRLHPALSGHAQVRRSSLLVAAPSRNSLSLVRTPGVAVSHVTCFKVASYFKYWCLAVTIAEVTIKPCSIMLLHDSMLIPDSLGTMRRSIKMSLQRISQRQKSHCTDDVKTNSTDNFGVCTAEKSS